MSMLRQGFPVLRFLSLAAAMLIVAACAVPQTTRTGAVHDIRVVEGPEPADLIVNPGDEVRWVNMRALPMRVDLVSVKPEDLSCERGFSNVLGSIQESATAAANQSVSVCFTRTGVINYNLRMDSALPGGKNIVSGVVRVGTNP